MFKDNRICQLFGITYPIIQAGMVWCSGWKLATAGSSAGGLGLIGAGSMNRELLKEHIEKASGNSTKPIGVNLPLMGQDIEDKVDTILDSGIRIVFTSAGNPAHWVPVLKEAGCTVAHVVASVKFARKAEDAGADAIVAEGFEAGGHNGIDETGSFVLIPSIAESTRLPLIAAGGMYDGRSLLAAQVLGADAIQVGSRFAVCNESSAHPAFKQKVLEIKEGDTRLVLKQIMPVRLIKNAFYEKVARAELEGKSAEELSKLLGRGRSRLGIFEGDLDEGELEIGQVASRIHKPENAAEIIQNIVTEYEKLLQPPRW